VALTYPGVDVTLIDSPRVLAPGVASIGPIGRQLVMGRIDEQALAIHVTGKGIVLVVGCGHQGLARILARAEALFDVPVYAIIGDLHYPVPEGRLQPLGINLQRLLASGEGPLSPLQMADVMADLSRLEGLPLGMVGLGGHDTSDEVIALFSQRFGERYRAGRVGDPITMGKNNTIPLSD